MMTLFSFIGRSFLLLITLFILLVLPKGYFSHMLDPDGSSFAKRYQFIDTAIPESSYLPRSYHQEYQEAEQRYQIYTDNPDNSTETVRISFIR